MPDRDRIELNPSVCSGKAVVRGTRIPVSVILEQIAEGESWDKILNGYPELSTDDIRAAIRYASETIDNTEIRAISA